VEQFEIWAILLSVYKKICKEMSKLQALGKKSLSSCMLKRDNSEPSK